MMKKDLNAADILLLKTILVVIILIPLTALSIYLAYDYYLFKKWPWIRFSIMMSILTCLWSYTFWFAKRNTSGKEDSLYLILYGIVVIPSNILLMYPGTKALGIHSDSDMGILFFLLQVIHVLGFYFIQKAIEKYFYDLKEG